MGSQAPGHMAQQQAAVGTGFEVGSHMDPSSVVRDEAFAIYGSGRGYALGRRVVEGGCGRANDDRVGLRWGRMSNSWWLGSVSLHSSALLLCHFQLFACVLCVVCLCCEFPGCVWA